MQGTPGFHCGQESIFVPFANPTITTEWNPASWLFPPLPAKQSQKCFKTMNGFMVILMKRRNVKPRIITVVKSVCYHALQIQLKALKMNEYCVFLLFSDRIAFCNISWQKMAIFFCSLQRFTKVQIRRYQQQVPLQRLILPGYSSV